ncbi:thermonuclease family protein [Brevibacillus dissolubilis]|uniref:thermonuclease family protein n=1 Tax=Brevibacillus dissolubilis TaxID=1844116 RepID=UPI00159B8C4A|nr:thermonuclease family protein [Brevibacillus dissolubilis]
MLTLILSVMLAACSTPANQPSDNGEMTATVEKVTDGDTFQLSTGERVRLIGVDTPETVKPNHPVEPYGKEASKYTKGLLTGQTVTLRFDAEPYDKYKRLLAYAYLEDGTFVNEKLVREGYARIMTIPPNVAFADTFLEAEREAREQNRGLWALEDGKDEGKAEGKETSVNSDSGTKEAATGQRPSSGQKSSDSTASGTSSQNPISDIPDPTKPIKGNINSKGEKIYHVPGGRYYNSTKAEEYFATEEDAQAAGFRRAK